jgi:hypothetical protein
MAVELYKSAYDYAKRLISEGKAVHDERDAWSEHQPSAAQENEFIRLHGYAEYAHWHLGIDNDKPEDTKARYKFPTEISPEYIAVQCSLPRAGLGNTSTLTSKMRLRICTA